MQNQSNQDSWLMCILARTVGVVMVLTVVCAVQIFRAVRWVDRTIKLGVDWVLYENIKRWRRRK